MKTTLLFRVSPLFCAVLCAGIADAQNPVPNPGFENWANDNPVGWNTSNSPFTGYSVTQNPTGHSGSTAARGTFLSSVAAPIMGLSDSSFQPLAISQAYEHLTFYYQLQLASTVGPELFTAGAQFRDGSGNTVGSALRLFDRTANTSTWTLADLPVTTVAPGTASVDIYFRLSGSNAVAGSYFVVDDVALTNGTTGVEELEQGAVLSAAYPAPATDAVNLPFTLEQGSTVQIEVLDALGRTVLDLNLGAMAPGRYKEVLDVQGWGAGMYTAALRTASGVRTQALMVAR